MTLELLGSMVQKVLDSQRQLVAEVQDLKARMTSLERHVGANGASETEHYAAVMGRMDRFDDRLSRVERRLELGDA